MNLPKPKTYYVWKNYGPDSPFTDLILGTPIAGDNVVLHAHTIFGELRLEPNNSFAAGLNNSVGGNNSAVIGGTNNRVNGNNSAIIGGQNLRLDADNTLLFDGEMRLRGDRQILAELDELKCELSTIKAMVENFLHGNQET